MLVIRFLRTGKKNQPFFRIVVTDKKNPPKGGRFLEILGVFNPLTKERNLKKERIKYWLSVGAQPSARVYNLLVSEKVLDGKKTPVHKKSKKKEEKPREVTAKAPAEKPVEEKESKEKLTEEKKEEKKKEAGEVEEKAEKEKTTETEKAPKTEEKPKEKPEEKPKEVIEGKKEEPKKEEAK